MLKKLRLIFCFLPLIAILFSACTENREGTSFSYLKLVPSHFDPPFLNQDSFPSEEQIILGRKLFFDPIMSVDSTISCGSCHKPEFAFSDTSAFSLGVNHAIGTRNTPTLSNVVYQKKLLREGGLPSLEMQVLVPIQEHNEFNFNIIELAERLNKIKAYRDLSFDAYNMQPNPFVITRSIAAFERILFSGESKYDSLLRGEANFTITEKLGMDLFFGNKTHCSSCHGTILFTNQTFENNGLYTQYVDSGRKRLTLSEDDDGRFKVPTLRNIELTAPYMHDGSIKTLKQVIEHYNKGGHPHKNKNTKVKPLGLTDEEKNALISFLYTLTDQKFISNKYLSHVK